MNTIPLSFAFLLLASIASAQTATVIKSPTELPKKDEGSILVKRIISKDFTQAKVHIFGSVIVSKFALFKV